MRPHDRDRAARLLEALSAFERDTRALTGIRSQTARDAFVEQLLESVRRVKYVFVIGERDIAPVRADPRSAAFDPLKAALFHHQNGRTDEAFWLVFLFVHFGKHLRTGYGLARAVYGSLGARRPWDWARLSANTTAFREWLDDNQEALRTSGSFGNHRKRESLNAWQSRGTGAAVEAYVNWIAARGSHNDLIEHARQQVGTDARRTFGYLYHSMDSVVTFGRTARFDYLCMLSKLGLAPIEPGSAFMAGATGPFDGARLLFTGDKSGALSRADADALLVQLGRRLDLQSDFAGHPDLTMQVMEDAVCNWQKSPRSFRAFRG